MTKPRIFVVQPIPEEGLAMLREVGEVEVFESDRMISRDELKAGLRRSDYLFTLGDTTIDDDILDANPDLKGIAAMSMLLNVIDIPAATRRGIPVTNIPHVIGRTTCDLTMAILLGLAWRIVEADAFTRAGRFRQEQSMSLMCHSITGKTVGIIGLGEIGQHIALRCRAFEMDVIYNKRTRLDPVNEAELGVAWRDDMDDVFREADFLVVMAKYTEETHLMIGERQFDLMKPSAFFINTARGRIVDEPALVKALQDGKIAGAGLDVYWCEPPVGEPAPSPELLTMPNVILTPHIGSATWDSRRQMAQLCARNIVAMIAGERPPDLMDESVYEVRRSGALTQIGTP
ncbi:2-hydroxyacid dehydrogenase [Mycobacterium sp. SMC-4]|uniref:2-hydroxyacid dehydrogenase n=1 Tax=Mycobacterium sp. SMC-4 TaxID=2857059 RepID=UPI003D000DF7